MTSPSKDNLFEHELSSLLTLKDRQYIDRYTKQLRKQTERPGAKPPLRMRVRQALEGWNRRLWYSIFEATFPDNSKRERIPIDKVRSVFIIPIGDAIGDMVVALPLCHTIKRHNPSCRVGTFYSPRNKALLRYDESLNNVYEFRNKDDVRHYKELFRARSDGYDVVINMHMPRMTEFGIISNILSPRGVKVCTSHARKDLYEVLFNNLLPYDRNSMHLSQLGLAMLESAIDFGRPLQQWESRPVISVSTDLSSSVKKRIKETLQSLGAKWYVHFNPQARNPTREWGLDNAMEFAKRFVEHYPDGAILFSASPTLKGDVESRIEKLQLERVAFFSTSYDLLELAELANNSELVVTPDTSVIHFGTASGKPTLVLWPDREHLPLEWIPLQTPSINLAPDVRGMLVPTIPVDSVWQAACKLLDKEWTSSATTMGLEPEADPLYQASFAQDPLQDLIDRSDIPRVFTDGLEESVPLSLIRKLAVHGSSLSEQVALAP